MKRTPLSRNTPLKRGGPLKSRSTTNSRRRKYRKEMNSPRWRELRKKVLERDNYACNLCGEDGTAESLEVHHTRYDRFGEEDGTELVTLCHSCHEAVGQLPRDVQRSKWEGELEAVV